MAAVRRKWLPERSLLFAISIVIAVTVTFAVTLLDLATARIFFHPPGTEDACDRSLRAQTDSPRL